MSFLKNFFKQPWVAIRSRSTVKPEKIIKKTITKSASNHDVLMLQPRSHQAKILKPVSYGCESRGASPLRIVSLLLRVIKKKLMFEKIWRVLL